ncbi:MAG: response regulator receiver protein [Gammaproteobacteria bacterium HGW-Gammaproteobacteria-10]|nr:MAG: response regulator receiver protein [Gammaproteobacteria bacterium HGW-Gammaproteobacteria-10]
MPRSKQCDAQEQLSRLRAQFLKRLPVELNSLKAIAENLTKLGIDVAALNELHHRLHKLSGSCGTFGVPALGKAARILEIRLQAWLEDRSGEIDDKIRQSIVKEIGALKDVIQPTENQSDASLAMASDMPIDKTVRVWLIEDDAAFEQELVRQLESFNFEVHLFKSIRDAETAAQFERPDLLIMNVRLHRLSEQDSILLQDRITLKSLDCPLLFVSSTDDFNSRVRAARLGAEGYFVKPVDITILINRMMHILEKRRAPPQRVLIIDDDNDLAAHYQLVLAIAGMQAEVLQQPEAVITKIANFRPEIILLDLHMPNFTGLDLAGVIRQYDEWSGLPIVFLSSESDLDIQILAMGQGADDFLMKPISDAQLIGATRARIERARRLTSLITKDSLTGLLKHASIKEAADLETAQARRNGKPVSIAMLDIDNFKIVNDTYGHTIGDNVIASLAMLLRQRLRHSDIIGRYGGEEFAAVLPECDQDDAYRLLDDIRHQFANIHFRDRNQRFNCTVSIGLADSAHFPRIIGTELLAIADNALYQAKREGRNRTCIARSIE